MTVSIEINDFYSVLLATLLIASMIIASILIYTDAKLRVAWGIFKQTGKWKTPNIYDLLEYFGRPRQLIYRRRPNYFEKPPKNEVTLPIFKKIKIFVFLLFTSLTSAFLIFYSFYF